MTTAKNSFTLTWCEKHKNWWVTNCPDCMVDANEESIKREGRGEMLEALKKEGWRLKGESVIPARGKFPEIHIPEKLKGWLVFIEETE